MAIEVKCGEIDRDNNPVGAPKSLGTFADRTAAEAFIQGEIARYDHNGFVPDGHQAGWWGRNDSDPYEKFHYWIEGGSDVAAPLQDRAAGGLP